MRQSLLAAAAVVVAVTSLTSAPVPKNLPGAGRIYVWGIGTPPTLTLLSPDGEHLTDVKLGTKEAVRFLSISPGGRYAAVERFGRHPGSPGSCWHVHLIDLKYPEDELPDPVAAGWNPQVCWSANGRTAYISTDTEDPFDVPKERQAGKLVLALDTKSGDLTPLQFTGRHGLMDLSPDGRSFLSREAVLVEKKDWVYSYHLLRGEAESSVTLSSGVAPHAFHPDGKRLFARRQGDDGVGGLLVDIVSGREEVLGWSSKVKEQIGDTPFNFEVSPDGKRVVVIWPRVVEKPDGWKYNFPCRVNSLAVCDLDGGNFKVIYTPEPKTMAELNKVQIRGFEWR
ncbi:MAG: hypothetical protein MUF18_12495 [Fimbriiglobus sp.]|jgi:hypothetical protein|nr:hypothetical protein [Fimbriiglobus sp.]